MRVESFAGGLRDGDEEHEVVLRGHQRAMPHVGAESGKPRLDVGPGAVPAQQGVYGEGKAQIVASRWRKVLICIP